MLNSQGTLCLLLGHFLTQELEDTECSFLLWCNQSLHIAATENNTHRAPMFCREGARQGFGGVLSVRPHKAPSVCGARVSAYLWCGLGRLKASIRLSSDPCPVSLPTKQFNSLNPSRSKKAQHKPDIKVLCNAIRYVLSPGRHSTGYKQTTCPEHVPREGIISDR